jgi:hypothetical protein
MRPLGWFLMIYGTIALLDLAPAAGGRDTRWWKRSRWSSVDERGWTRDRVIAAAFFIVTGIAAFAIGLVLVYRS